MIGFASHVLSHEAAVIHIPDELSSELAAPLMSAGITVFNSLFEFKLKEERKGSHFRRWRLRTFGDSVL